jgi:polyisoprenoid-binding protein YceI
MVLELKAQNWNLEPEKSSFLIKGDSTLHEWEMTAEDYEGYAVFEESEVISIDFKAKAEGLESGKGKMNSLTYEALKSEEHPYITYKVSKIEKTPEGYLLFGNMTIAGFTQEIELLAQGEQNDGELHLKGSYVFDMTTYEMTPPKAVFGTIVVDKELEVVYDLYFINN